METKYRRTTTCEVKNVKTSFNISDQKGRVIGFVITVLVCTWAESSKDAVCWYTNNPNYIARTSVTRDGVRFGATTGELHGNTLREVMAKAVTRRENALARYTKRFS